MVVGSSSSHSASSLSSFGGSSDDAAAAARLPVVKFLCSYGGKILPRHPDGRLRYVGGDTRVLAVDRAAPFSEVAAKMAELCGWGVPVSVRCQLPTEDLDALVSVSSDEDLANVLEEYDLASRDRESSLKVKAFLTSQRAPVTPPSAVKGKTPCAQHLHGHHRQNFSSSRLPTRPSRAVCNGQQHRCYHHHHEHQHRACFVHGGTNGFPAGTSYRLAMPTG